MKGQITQIWHTKESGGHLRACLVARLARLWLIYILCKRDWTGVQLGGWWWKGAEGLGLAQVQDTKDGVYRGTRFLHLRPHCIGNAHLCQCPLDGAGLCTYLLREVVKPVPFCRAAPTSNRAWHTQALCTNSTMNFYHIQPGLPQQKRGQELRWELLKRIHLVLFGWSQAGREGPEKHGGDSQS